jgi:hypothetical protein
MPLPMTMPRKPKFSLSDWDFFPLRIAQRKRPMPSYILRKINPELWARFKARSESEGIPMRALMLLLIKAYADREINLQAERTDR